MLERDGSESFRTAEEGANYWRPTADVVDDMDLVFGNAISLNLLNQGFQREFSIGALFLAAIGSTKNLIPIRSS